MLNYSQATQPLLLIPVGPGVFRPVLRAVSLLHRALQSEDARTRSGRRRSAGTVEEPHDAPAQKWVRALGGAANLRAVDACTTRLRLVVADQKAVDEAALKALGARGCLRPSDETLQVVVGPDRGSAGVGDSRASSSPGSPTERTPRSRRRIVAALGGAANLKEVQVAASRLLVDVAVTPPR